jgi:hypothetical protein
MNCCTENLQEVFGEGDAARRRAAIDELYTDDCALYVPPGVFVGHDALDKFAGDLRATHPHFAYTPHGSPQALHNAGRLTWGSGPHWVEEYVERGDLVVANDDYIQACIIRLLPGRAQPLYLAPPHIDSDGLTWLAPPPSALERAVCLLPREEAQGKTIASAPIFFSSPVLLRGRGARPDQSVKTSMQRH